MMRSVTKKFYVLLLVGLLAGLVLGCDDDDVTEPPEFGELGGVEVGAGEAVHIRTLLDHIDWANGDVGDASRNATEIAVRDFGDIHGHEVALGIQVNSGCSSEGGETGAQQIVADSRVVGVIGTSCSGAGAAASALLSEAGLVMISPSNTSPSLTSDLAGNANSNYRPGYFRISNNDLYTGQAAADFAYELGLRRMGIVDIDDAYIAALANAFSDAFEDLGGEVVVATRIMRHQTDMTDALTELAAADPEGIFFPVYDTEGIPFVEQARAVNGLKEVTLISADAAITEGFLGTPEAVDVYMAGPPTSFDNVNSVTGKNEEAVGAAAEAIYGDPLSAPFWQHAYDATTLLLDAIQTIAVQEGGKLYIDRAALREEIGTTDDLQGLTGVISCDDFGDCGTGLTYIFHHTDAEMTDPAELPDVYQFTP